MPVPFLVMATQNPIEYEGTFPLPEAQLDRFLMRIRLGYPLQVEEMEILDPAEGESTRSSRSIRRSTVEELVELQQVVRRDVEVSPLVREYIVALVSSHAPAPGSLPGRQPARVARAISRQPRRAPPCSGATSPFPTT